MSRLTAEQFDAHIEVQTKLLYEMRDLMGESRDILRAMLGALRGEKPPTAKMLPKLNSGFPGEERTPPLPERPFMKQE